MINRNIKAALFCGCVAFFSACKGSGYWMEQLDANPLHQSVIRIRASPICARLVPMEFTESLPIPAHGRDGGFFKLLFYRSIAPKNSSSALTPIFEGIFAANGPEKDGCIILSMGMINTASTDLSLSAYYQAKTQFYASLERVAPLYFNRTTLTPQDVKTLAEFVDLFEKAAEPGLMPNYYQLNPDFWEWVRANAGRSIPAS